MDKDETDTPSRSVSIDFSKLLISKPKVHIYSGETIRRDQYSAREIIERVSRDVTVMRNADVGPATSVARNVKTPSIPMTSFAAVMDNSGRRCEMQTVTDTEMMDAADGAEAILQMINNKGMTQLFDVSFNNKVNIRRERPLGELVSINNHTVIEKDFHKVVTNDVIELERNEEHATLDTVATHVRNDHVNKEDKHFVQNRVADVLEDEVIGIYEDDKKNGIKTKDLSINERNTDVGDRNIEVSLEERIDNVSELMIENIRPPSPVLVPTIKFMKSKTAKEKRKVYSLEAFEEIETSFNKRFKSQEYSVSDEKIYSLCVNKGSDEAADILNDNNNIDILFSSNEEGYRSLSVSNLDKSLESLNSEVIGKCIEIIPRQNANSSGTELEQKIKEQTHKKNFKKVFEEHDRTIENQTLPNIKSSSHIQQQNVNNDNEFDITLQEFHVDFDEKDKFECTEKVLHEMESNNNLELIEMKTENAVALALNNSSETIIQNERNEPSYNDIVEEMKEFLGFTSSNTKGIDQIEAHSNTQKTQNEINSKQVCQTTYQRFTTACNKNNVVSKKAFTKTKALFKDILEISLENKTIKNESSDSELSPKLDKFMTTNEKPIPIPKETLDKTKNLSLDIEGITMDEEFVDRESKESECEPQFKGFTTSSDTIEALKNLKYILHDIKGISMDDDFVESEEHECEQGFQEFITASSKHIEALDVQAKTKNQNTENIEEIRVQDDFIQYEGSKAHAPKFKGFTTASNKNIKVSEQALAKSKTIFHDIEVLPIDDKTDDHKFKLPPKFQGFTTASNKNIKVSQQAIAKTKTLFHDIEVLPTENRTEDHKIEPPSKIQGFTTASNKNIKVSEQAIAKTKTLFHDIEVLPTEGKTDDHKFELPPKFQGFATASNKNIKVSEQAIAKTKTLFHDIEVLPTEDRTEDHKIEPPPKFQGFTTASNKNIKVSEQAIAKTKTLFHDIEVLDTEDKTDDHKFELPPKFQGFTTASNKNIKVSEQAIAKTKTLFHDIEVLPTEDRTEDHKFEPPPKFQGFTTASNKNIKVSELALAKTKTLFHNIEDLPTKNKTDDHEFASPPKCQGFTSASNKIIKISEQALAKNKYLFHNIENLSSEHKTEDQKFKPPPTFQGFNNANNKHVRETQEALAKAKNLFQDIENIPNKCDINEDITHKDFYPVIKLQGTAIAVSEESLTQAKNLFQDFEDFNATDEFKTANNKDIEISKEAIAITKDVFQNIEGKQEKKITFEGFSTGNKKMIKVSEAALEKTKNLFNNLEISQTSDKENDTSNAIETDEPEIKDKSDDLLNTQIMHHFEDTMYTEDFCKTPENIVRSKKSGSPILQMSAKRRKIFKVPYRIGSKIAAIGTKTENLAKIETTSNYFVYKFDDNYKICVTERISLKKFKFAKNQTTAHHFDFDNVTNFKFIKNDLTDSPMSSDTLKNIFLNSVDRKIVPEGWLNNHIKLIIWKLISYELNFPEHFHQVVSPKNVLEQLKYRYDRELYKVERPALRKILERDETSGRCMVLCVVRILFDGAVNESATNTTELEVTDGWYCLRATIDKVLSKAVSDGKIVSGTKIITQGAELSGCDQGIAPWEDTSLVRLKLYGNSTRRVRWQTRLGLHPASVAVGLRTLTPEGGKASKVRLFVARVYPLLFVEKFEDGSTVTRSERLESIQAAKHENDRLARLDSIYQELEREMHMTEDSQELTATLTRARGGEAEILTESQCDQINQHSSKKREEMLEKIQKRLQEKIEHIGLDKMQRNVIPLLKIRVCTWNALSRSIYEKESKNLKPSPENYEKESKTLKPSPENYGKESKTLKPSPENYGKQSKNLNPSQKYEKVEMTKACMSVWKPSENLLDVIKEGVWIDAMNVVPTAVRMSELHISAGRQSIFKRVQNNEFSKTADSVARKCANIKDLRKITYSPFNEVDFVGLTVQIDPKTSDFEKLTFWNQNSQNVYLCDADKNMVSVHFWGGLKKFGFDKVIETKQFVSCSNLQVRMGNTRKSIPQFRVTEFSVFTKVPKNENSSTALEALRKEFENVDLDTFCSECITNKNVCTKASENESPYRFNNKTEYNLSKHKIFIDSPYLQKINKNDINLTGLDFESTFKLDSQLTEAEALRKSKIRSKIEKLKMYGEPPPLSPMHIMNKSSRVENAFVSPILNKSKSVTADEDSVTSNTKEIRTSPVLKSQTRRPNPVKLDFSKDVASSSKACDNVAIVRTFKEVNEEDFSEEFEYSPPLSLDSNDL